MSEFVRRLHLNLASGISEVDVKLAEPSPQGGSWACHYEIGWPEGAKVGEVWGADAVQAFYLTMQAIALQLYASAHHESGRLYWQKPGKGYGFPLPKNVASELVGDDKDAF
jgi:hypothetical protein